MNPADYSIEFLIPRKINYQSVVGDLKNNRGRSSME